MIKKDEIEKFYNVDYSSREVDIYIKRLHESLGFNNLLEFKVIYQKMILNLKI